MLSIEEPPLDAMRFKHGRDLRERSLNPAQRWRKVSRCVGGKRDSATVTCRLMYRPSTAPLTQFSFLQLRTLFGFHRKTRDIQKFLRGMNLECSFKGRATSDWIPTPSYPKLGLNPFVNLPLARSSLDRDDGKRRMS